MKFLFFLSFTFAFISCVSEKEREKAIVSYGIINVTFDMFHEVQQEFLDQLTNAALQVKIDNNAVIDTQQLRDNLDSAKQAANRRLGIIKTVEETNDNIKYKEKAIAYVSLFNSAYENEFLKFIEILEGNSANKYEESVELLTPVLLKIKEAEKTILDANSAMKDKYDFNF